MSKLLFIDGEYETKVVTEALEQWVKQVKNSEDQTDLDGVQRSLVKDVQPVEELIIQLEHSTDQPLEEVAYSAIAMQLNEDQIVALFVQKIGAKDVLASIPNSDIEDYFNANIKAPEVETPEQ